MRNGLTTWGGVWSAARTGVGTALLVLAGIALIGAALLLLGVASPDRLATSTRNAWQYSALLTAIVLGSRAAILDWRMNRQSVRRSRGECPRCGYDLRATPDQCPECGMRLDEEL